MSGLPASFEEDQREVLPLVPTLQDCKDRTFVVTGSNTGLGFECAKHLVALGAAKVIIAVRSVERGEAAKAKIESDTGVEGIAEVWQVDLASFASVKSFVKKLEALERVDVAILNASLALDKKGIAEGLEMSLTVNVVSTFLMAAMILPLLQETGKKFGGTPHLVVVGSGAGFSPERELEKYDGDILKLLSDGPMTNRYYCPSASLALPSAY